MWNGITSITNTVSFTYRGEECCGVIGGQSSRGWKLPPVESSNDIRIPVILTDDSCVRCVAIPMSELRPYDIQISEGTVRKGIGVLNMPSYNSGGVVHTLDYIMGGMRCGQE